MGHADSSLSSLWLEIEGPLLIEREVRLMPKTHRKGAGVQGEKKQILFCFHS